MLKPMANISELSFSSVQENQRDDNCFTLNIRDYHETSSIKSMLSINDTVLDKLDNDNDNDNGRHVSNYQTINFGNTSASPTCRNTYKRCEENIGQVSQSENDDWNISEFTCLQNVEQNNIDSEALYNTSIITKNEEHCAIGGDIIEEDINWQDETLLNQALSTVELLGEKQNVSSSYRSDSEHDLDFIAATPCKEEINSLHHLVPNSNIKTSAINKNQGVKPVNIIPENSAVHGNHRHESTLNFFDDMNECIKDSWRECNSNKLKVSTIFENDTPRGTEIKKRRTDRWDQTSCLTETSSKRSDYFYGLPNKVKVLIQEVKGISDLYRWQDECLNLEAIKNRKNLIYALPTSGGKTLVAEILMLREIICNNKNAIFVLPFVAIVQEKVRSMAPFALELGFLVEEYAGGKGQYPPRKRHRKNSIYICTIEKALGLVHSLIELKRLDEIGIVVVDELHLLGEDGGRGATLEGILTKIKHVNDCIHIIGMSATIGNLHEIASFLNADIYTQNFRPIELKEYVKCENDIWLVNAQEEEILTDPKKINYSYSETAMKLDPDRLGGLVMDVVPKDSCLVFCPSRKNCENVALLLCKVLFSSLKEYKKEEKIILLNALKMEGALCPILRKTVVFGIAYHHSGLTCDERKLLEEAFQVGTISVICCTSTLAAGVNLPARRVILRSPYVGNEFLSVSRYKQMIGRAGRAGMRETGESILICKSSEISKVKELLTSKMDDSLSTMHIEEERGINNLILSAILFSLATTRFALHKFVASTLLAIQQRRLGVDIKKVTDKAITTLMKAGVIKVKESMTFNSIKPNLTVVIPSQLNPDSGNSTGTKGKKKIMITSKTELEICQLGRAAMKASIDQNRSHTLYEDLKVAQNHLVLLDYLHLLYVIIPYDLANQIKPVGSVYYDVVTRLSPSQMETARVLGIDEVTVSKLRDGITPKNVQQRVVHRFYLTLMLHELCNRQSVHAVAEKYQINRGLVQNLLHASMSFASSIIRFCQEMDEFWAFDALLTSLSKKLSYCCTNELESLMELPAVKIGRAWQLYNAGYKTLQSIAMADPITMQKKIKNFPKKTVNQIIAAANLLILEKVENLRDEAEDVLEGLDMNHIMENASFVHDKV